MAGSSNGSRRSARIAVGLWIVAVVLLTSAPYLVLATDTRRVVGEGGRYTWLLPPYPEDGLAYTSWVKQAADGSLLFKLKFTQIPQRGVLFHPFFLVVGWLSAVGGWSSGFALFVARIPAVVVFLLVLYRFGKLFLPPGPELAVGLALVTLSSGFGLRGPPGDLPSADLWMPEINTLWSLTWNPLFVVALTLMMGAIGLVAAASTRSERRNGGFLAAGGLTGLLAFTHAYDVVVVAVVVFVLSVLRLGRRAFGPLVAFAALALPAATIQWWIATHDPVLAAHGASGVMTSPSVLSYAAAMGLPGLFAMYGAVRWVRSRSTDRLSPLFLWIVASLILAYSPIWFQRKMIMGIHIPICLVAAIGLCDVARRLARGRMSIFAGLAIVSVALSSVTQVRNARSMIEEVDGEPAAYYLSPELVRALRFLDERTEPDEVVLAYYDVARHVPGKSGNTVTLGHWAQSVDLDAHMRWLGELLAPGPSPTAGERQQALRRSPIDYILVDPRMRDEWLRGAAPVWLEEIGETVYEGGGIRILEVTRPAQSRD